MFIQIVLACALVSSPFAVAQYSSSQASTEPLLERGTVSAGRLTLTNVQLPELKGLWQNVGRETPHSHEMATDNETLPDCSMDSDLNSYVGLDSAPGWYYVLAGTGGVNAMMINRQRSTFSPNATLNGSIIVTAGRGGVPSCNHFQTYIDLSTGVLMAETLGMTMWSVNASDPNGKPARTNINCELKGNELPGCYTGAVNTSGPAVASTAPTPSVAISSIVAPAPRPSGGIVTVTKNTWTCLNGECLRLSPKSSTSTPAYGG